MTFGLTEPTRCIKIGCTTPTLWSSKRSAALFPLTTSTFTRRTFSTGMRKHLPRRVSHSMKMWPVTSKWTMQRSATKQQDFSLTNIWKSMRVAAGKRLIPSPVSTKECKPRQRMRIRRNQPEAQRIQNDQQVSSQNGRKITIWGRTKKWINARLGRKTSNAPK